MKRLSLDEWKMKYSADSVERFDQKNQMFYRIAWDDEVKDILKDWSYNSEPSDKPGYALKDSALRLASWSGERISLFNISKPNPSPVAKAVVEAMTNGRPQANAQVRERPKVDTSDTAALANDIKKAALYFGADVVGICRLDNTWVYSNSYQPGRPTPDGNTGGQSLGQEIPEEYQYAVVMGFEEDYEMMKYSHTLIANATCSLGYSRMAITNAHLSDFIRNLGYEAIDCSTNDVALSIPLAMLAGLGDLGRSGLLISPRYGPRLRLSKVFTNLPLATDSPIDFGVTEFCDACMKCAEMCPSRSISFNERTTEPISPSNSAGALKWPANGVTCRTYWGRVHRGCSICIASCPYNKADTWFHRMTLWLTDHARWAAPFFVAMDNLFGYGRPKNADNFWEEWQPK